MSGFIYTILTLGAILAFVVWTWATYSDTERDETDHL